MTEVTKGLEAIQAIFDTLSEEDQQEMIQELRFIQQGHPSGWDTSGTRVYMSAISIPSMLKTLFALPETDREVLMEYFGLTTENTVLYASVNGASFKDDTLFRVMEAVEELSR